MTNLSSGSNNSSSRRSRGSNGGVPTIFWCGRSILELVSRKDTNPFRRFYRCAYAAEKMLEGDDHIFQWVDETLLNEIRFVDVKAKKVEEEVKEMKIIMVESIEYEKKMFEKMEMDLESRISERIKLAVLDAKWNLWKTMCVLVVIGFIIIIGCSKLLG